MKIQIELVEGFGLAVTWHRCPAHDFAVIFLFFAIKFKFRE